MLRLAGTLAVFVVLTGKATSKFCDGKYFCDPPKQCCTLGCCYLYAPPSPNLLSLIFWNHWYLWCAVAVAVACGCGCGLYKRKSRGGPGGTGGARGGGPGSGLSEPPTPDSCYRPPTYSRCSSFHQPPPYAEVTSKPDLYPLVISYSENGKSGGNYLMVQYFRNYIMRPVGSLSATSTADSLSSSLFCSAANEANSLIPPPYSSAPGSVEQINAQSTQNIEEPVVCGLRGCGGGTLDPQDTPRVGAVVPVGAADDSRGAGAGAGGGAGGGERRQARPSLCGLSSNVSSESFTAPLDSPPRATSPTSGKAPSQTSSRSKYRGKGWLSRSAPSTPSSALAPASAFESSPLLAPDDLDNTF